MIIYFRLGSIFQGARLRDSYHQCDWGLRSLCHAPLAMNVGGRCLRRFNKMDGTQVGVVIAAFFIGAYLTVLPLLTKGKAPLITAIVVLLIGLVGGLIAMHVLAVDYFYHALIPSLSGFLFVLLG